MEYGTQRMSLTVHLSELAERTDQVQLKHAFSRDRLYTLFKKSHSKFFWVISKEREELSDILLPWINVP